MEPGAIAGTVVAFLSPYLAGYLVEAGKGAAHKTGEMLLTTLAKWVRGRSGLREAIDGLRDSPRDRSARDSMCRQLIGALHTDPEFLTEMTQLLVERSVLFHAFANAPSPLSDHIRVREFEALVEERTKGFVGRGFVFSAVEAVLGEPDFPSGYIIISGEPGIGKTALLAQMTRQEAYVHHFNVASQNIVSARSFLNNVCGQLVVRYGLDHSKLPSKAAEDSGFLSRLLSESAANERDRPVVILVDALDEAEETKGRAEANRLYLPPTVPDGVYFIVTTRDEADCHLLVDRRKDIRLRDDDPRNVEDVAQYIRSCMSEHPEQMKTRISQWDMREAEFVELLTERSEGNFMYLVYVLGDIRDGRLTTANIADIRSLPKGLEAYYQRHWRLMKQQDANRFEKYYEPVVCFLATARESITLAQVVEWTELPAARVLEVLREWRRFLNDEEAEDGERSYRIYHSSFRDFLAHEVGLTLYHDAIARKALAKIPGFDGDKGK